MADVTDVAPGGGSERGQMLLIAAFAIAVMLVVLVLTLNTAIYTENLATRGGDISGGRDAVRYQAATSSTVAGTIERVNYENNSSYGALFATANASVEDFNAVGGRQQARQSVVTNVSVRRHSAGTRIYQHGDDTFTNASDGGNWTVVRDSAGVRNVTMNLSGGGLVTGLANDPFYVNFSNPDDDEWYRVYVYTENGSGDLVVAVEPDGGTVDDCVRPFDASGRAEIDVTNASVQGQRCSSLAFFSSFRGESFDVHFNYADRIDGRYSLVANRSEGDVTSVSDPPNTTVAIYSTTVQLSYESKRLLYRTDLRLAPREPEGYHE